MLRPDPDKVQDVARGAAPPWSPTTSTISAPGLTAFAQAMEQALGGKVQGNLYLSSRRRQGFAAHFDTHDVYAVHVEGTKTWHVYEGRAEDPIAHPVFKTLPPEHHEKARGRKLMDVPMEPGDLLYLPRGQYHDALADEGGAVHIAFGVTYPIGIDVMSLLFERVVAEPEFRANLPRRDRCPTPERALAAHLDALAGAARQGPGRAPDRAADRGAAAGLSLSAPQLRPAGPAERRPRIPLRVRAKGIRLVQQGGRFGLVPEGSRAATEVPAEVSGMVAWVLERPEFSAAELAAAFPDRQPGQREQLLRDLAHDASDRGALSPWGQQTSAGRDEISQRDSAVAKRQHCGFFVAPGPHSQLMA